MSYRSILARLISGAATPQSQPLPGQVPNSAGGWGYAIDDWARLDRFLILGSADGTYYADPAALTRDNAFAVERALAADGPRAVDRIVAIGESARAPKQDPALLALAVASAAADEATRARALAALPRVARTGTHLLAFAGLVNETRGWGRGLRRAVARWFLAQPVERLALQAVKYASRDGWSLRDLLRLAHPLTDEPARKALFDWIAHPESPSAIAGARSASALVDGMYRTRAAVDAVEVAAIVRAHRLPREAVPTQFLADAGVLAALLADMPMTATIRSLGRLAAAGAMAPLSDAARLVTERLADRQALAAARVHPVQLLLALRTYAQGQGMRGRLAWAVDAGVVDALDRAMDAAIDAVEPTGKRVLVALDVSGSMHGSRCAGSPVLSALDAAAAVALTFVRVERAAHVVAFDTEAREAAISARQRLDDVLAILRQWRGGTDVSAPIRYALDRRLVVDGFVVVTDSETWAGNEHPAEALARYRATINPAARIVVLAAAANRVQVVPADDPLALGIAGFDAAAPALIADFLRG